MKDFIADNIQRALLPLYHSMLNNVRHIGYKKAVFCVQWGKNYPCISKHGILFVGRATNGWVAEVFPDNDVEKDLIYLFTDPQDRIFNRVDQMQWVEKHEGSKKEYNTRKSAFWRVIKTVTRHFHHDNWSSYIAWSNLYKVAPSKGNPTNDLRHAQLKDCVNIIKTELDTLSPQIVVLLTGNGWAKDFLLSLNEGNTPKPIRIEEWSRYKASVYDINGTIFIVSEHPQGKSEWKHSKCLINIISDYI